MTKYYNEIYQKKILYYHNTYNTIYFFFLEKTFKLIAKYIYHTVCDNIK